MTAFHWIVIAIGAFIAVLIWIEIRRVVRLDNGENHD